jgi:hypothetical protein
VSRRGTDKVAIGVDPAGLNLIHLDTFNTEQVRVSLIESKRNNIVLAEARGD